LSLKKLDKSDADIVLKRMAKVLKNPELGKPLHSPLQGHRSERARNLRIVYKVEKGRIVFVFLGHRKEAYG
jgi:mRNA-degrading endonuclease RelE of RelBE toxin-antitoxin system